MRDLLFGARGAAESDSKRQAANLGQGWSRWSKIQGMFSYLSIRLCSFGFVGAILVFFFFPATIMSRAFVLRALWVHKLIRYNRRTIPRYGQPVPSQLLLCSFLLHAVRVATIFSCTPDSFDSSNLCLSRLLTLSSPFSLRSSQNVHRQI